MDRHKVSVTIITFNEEHNIQDCLRSVEWADEVVVVDSGSSDKTVEIAREFTDKVFVNPWPGHKQQKNFAVDKASNEWILSVDADERVTDGLREFVLEELRSPGYAGYRFSRKGFFFGVWQKHGGWYPDYVLRLFRRDKGRFGGENPHDRVIINNGQVKDVRKDLLHYTYTNLTDQLKRLDSYADIQMRERFDPKRSYAHLPYLLPFKAVFKFVEFYFIKRAFLDGKLGIVRAGIAGFSSFWKYAKLYELSIKQEEKEKDKGEGDRIN